LAKFQVLIRCDASCGCALESKMGGIERRRAEVQMKIWQNCKTMIPKKKKKKNNLLFVLLNSETETNKNENKTKKIAKQKST
jgi:hypothetical protein